MKAFSFVERNNEIKKLNAASSFSGCYDVIPRGGVGGGGEWGGGENTP